MEESILLSSDSNPSSPPVLLAGDLDLDLPRAKLSDICGDKKSGDDFSKFSYRTSSPSTYNAEPIAHTFKCIPPSLIYNVVTKDSESDRFASSSAQWKYESRPSTSGITKNVEGVTDLNVHELSDSDAGLSDFLSDSDNESFLNRDDVKPKNSPVDDLCLTYHTEEHPKWVSLMDEDTDPPSSRSSSTLPPEPDQVHDTLYASISSCSTLPPHQTPDAFLQSSDSFPTLGLPDVVLPGSLSTVPKFEKKQSFHDLSESDGGSSDTIEPEPNAFPDRFGLGEVKSSYPDEISLSEDEPENPSSTSPPSTAPFCSTQSAELLALHSEPILSNSYSISDFVSQPGTNSQPLTSASSQRLPSWKTSRTKVNDVFERKRLKELKMKEKSERAAVAERVRRMKPGECMKYVTVLIDQNMVSEYPWSPAVIEILQQSGIKYSVEVATDPCTVKWAREQADTLIPLQEKHVLFLWSTDKLFTSIQYGTLSDNFAEFKKKYENHKLYLCVYGLHDYYRKFHRAKQRQNNNAGPPQRKRKSNYEITPDQLEMELIALQIKFGISHKILNSPQDTAFFLQVITKSIAELPFKLEKEKVEMERNWYAKGDSKKCVRIDKDFNGLRQLWLQQLSQFNLSSLDIAKSIAELYPTPLSLYNAYLVCTSLKEKENMLQDIVVKRGPGGGGRRLGPELSRKISIMFCQDEEIPLG